MSEHVKSKDAEPKQKADDRLHQGLEETFPASDAPASTQPGSGRKPAETAHKSAKQSRHR